MAAGKRGRSPSSGDRSKSNEELSDAPGYEVGRGRPPLHSRFKPGGPGGPGRPKRAKNRHTLFEAEMETTLTVNIDGKPRALSKRQLGYRNLASLFAKGDLRAIALAEQLQDRFTNPADQREQNEASHAELTEAEIAILNRRSGQ